MVISILSALDVNISTNKRYEMLQLKMTNAGMIVFLIIFVKKDNEGFWRSWRKRFCSSNLKPTTVQYLMVNKAMQYCQNLLTFIKKCFKLIQRMPTVSIRLN